MRNNARRSNPDRHGRAVVERRRRLRRRRGPTAASSPPSRLGSDSSRSDGRRPSARRSACGRAKSAGSSGVSWSERAPARRARPGSASGARACAACAAGGRRPRPQKPRLKKLRIAFVVAGLALLAVVSWVFGLMMAVAQDLPDLEARAQYDRAQNSVVLAADGTELATLTGNEGRILLESEEIAPTMKQAVVAIEDERFYEHRGDRLPRHRPAAAAGHPLRRRCPGRLDDHPAVRQERARGAGQPDGPAEAARGGARLPDRAPVVEGQDPHQLPEQHLLRQRRLRDRGRRPHLLRLERTTDCGPVRRPLRRGADAPTSRRCSPR